MGSWVAENVEPSGAGELHIAPGAIKLNAENNGGTDQTAALSALTAGQTVYVIGQDGHAAVTLDHAPDVSALPVIELRGTIVTAGTVPTGSDGVHVIVDASPAAAPSPAPPPPAVDETGGDGSDMNPAAGFDPADHTAQEVKDHVTGLGASDHPAVAAATRRILETELAGKDRAGLTRWLEDRLGIG